ncbi:3',5'-cyclic-nucleotide phosphodiesterase [Thauera sp. CAU 1555]|jgi:3',5'-cyclic-nucleotide phosphodiesterase|uniref:3',5'-cyclic-nucleotide phosphodiesterase n=1 Tax=Thauera sedimentorum TaxID=2767595 RepID=A0ABR9BDU9_9RHOO|nr:3',5'-cyclic-nucleotide phosphodiesterase [Thauera sedimentorum]MBC9073594.1 3',5'-cyclic-nucleotide phosphodiesterase [Thauera sedimentorum]MBD8504513.1 3',5'-cyclic-nucleotide phosphodiesterase [Thauera sedimentorum]
MKLTVLGCSGGIGGARSRTTSFLVDDDILLDCGTGVGDLELDALRAVDHVFVTHAHLDHIASIPLLIDSVGESRRFPLTVYGSPETLRILRSHIFNWLIWPDFTAIPNRHRPFLRLQPVKVGECVRLGERAITALPAHHTVPALGYCLDSGAGKLVYTGDTTYCKPLIAALNQTRNLRHLIVETAFPDEQHGLALASRHLSPSLLGAMLDELEVSPQVYISHLKPGVGERIMAQIACYAGRLRPRALVHGEILEF